MVQGAYPHHIHRRPLLLHICVSVRFLPMGVPWDMSLRGLKLPVLSPQPEACSHPEQVYAFVRQVWAATTHERRRRRRGGGAGGSLTVCDGQAEGRVRGYIPTNSELLL